MGKIGAGESLQNRQKSLPVPEPISIIIPLPCLDTKRTRNTNYGNE